MKTIFYFPVFLILTSVTLFTSSCSSSKKAHASKTSSAKKEKAETSDKKTNSTTTTVKKKTTSTTTAVTPKSDAFVPLVPNSIENVFKTNYPTATDVEWSKETVSTTNKTAEYKAAFAMNKNKNWVIYNENGDLVESRIQIAPDQLPQNIYKAIQKKYPNAHIVSATTLKNSKKDGSYAAMIKPSAEAKDVEVILTENGTFVQ